MHRRIVLCVIAVLMLALAVPAVAAPSATGATARENWRTSSAAEQGLWSPNPLLAFGAEYTKQERLDWARRTAEGGAARAAAGPRVGRTVNVAESEPNNSPGTADPVPGFGVAADPAATITGSMPPGPAPVVVAPAAEDDGDLTKATATGLTVGNAIRYDNATIGNGPHGSAGTGNGDVDVYAVNMTAGQTVTADIDASLDGSDLDSYVIIYDAAGNIVAENDDSSNSLDSFVSYSATSTETHYVLVSAFLTEGLSNPNDSSTAGGSASEGPYDVQISLIIADLDVFAVTLAAGDVLGATLSTDGFVSIVAPDMARLMIKSNQDLSFAFPEVSPIMGGGPNATIVADTAGLHFVVVSDVMGSYELSLQAARRGNLRLRKDVAEVVFLDFDGAEIPADLFGFGSPASTLSPLSDFLGDFGLAASQESDVIDSVIASVRESLRNDLRTAANGNHAASGTSGEFNVVLRNSRDHTDPAGQPGVSRVVIGGTIEEFGIPTIGLAQSIDIGNYSPNETAVVLLGDLLATECFIGIELDCFRGPDTDDIELVGTGVGNIVVHEIGHYVGNFHTDSLNATHSLMDEGGNLPMTVGVGDDGIFGTADDKDVDFVTDDFSLFEGILGRENTRDISAFGLSTGTATSSTKPVANDDAVTFTTSPGLPAPVLVGNDSDAEFDELTFAVTSPPDKGTLTPLPGLGAFTYVPDTLGSTSFTYTITDVDGTSNEATVTLDFQCAAPNGTLDNAGFEAPFVDEFPNFISEWCGDLTAAVVPWMPVEAGEDFGDDLFTPAPTEGDQAAIMVFPFFPGPISLSQVFEIPESAAAAQFSFDWRAGWIRDVGCGDCEDDIDFDLLITDFVTGEPVLSQTIVGMPVDDDTADTGPQDLTVDLGDVAGRKLRASFDLQVPNTFNFPGYGRIQLDDVVLDIARRPATTADAYTVPFGGAVTVAAADGLLDNDAADGPGPLTAALAEGATNGTVSLSANGGFTYTHDGSATLTDTFTYTAKDADATSLPQTVNITIGTDQIVRLFGENRISTSVAISQSTFPSTPSGRATGVKAPAVVLARADNFADGLAGTPFAASVGAPVLLTFPGELHPEAAAELKRVLAAGGTVHLLGGEVALSKTVADAVTGLGFKVERISGETRYDTAVEIAKQLGDVDTILIARGDAFPDALAAGPAAIATGAAIVLTTPETASDITKAYLASHTGAKVYATGGPAARAFPSADGLIGETRHETAVMIAEEFFEDPVVAALAVSSNFADALSGGVHIGSIGGPVLLTPTGALDPAVSAYLTAGKDDIRVGFVYGGPVALAAAIETSFGTAIR